MAFNIAPFNVVVVYASIKFMEKYVIFFTSGVLGRIKQVTVSHAATSFNAAACHSRITGKQSRKERLANFAILCLVSLVYRG